MHRFTRSFFDRRRCFLWRRQVVAAVLTAVLLLQSATAVAPGPAWWGSQQVLDDYAYPDDFAAANVGQLKYIATKAAAAMNAELPGGAGTAINDLIASWGSAPAAGVVRDDFQALNHGQLKNVAKLFYDRLSLPYPWAGGAALRDDFLWANVGQLKNIFSFALSFRSGTSSPITIPPATLAAAQDAWESLLDAPEGSTADDFDGDGIPNLQEYLMGSPLFDALDIDGDRIPDLVEDLYPGILSKLRFADAVEDYDEDGVMNFEELALGLDPGDTASGSLADYDVLTFALLRGGPLTPFGSDSAAEVWAQIDATWMDAHWLSEYWYYWLDEADANANGEADGLEAFRSEFSVATSSLTLPSFISEDIDYDQMPNLWEYAYALDLRSYADASADLDGDEWDNLDEYQNGTNPRLADTDGDGFADKLEYTMGGDPASGSSLPGLVLTKVSGPDMVRLEGVSPPLTVQVTQAGVPYAGAEVTFEVGAGNGSLRAGNAAATTVTAVTGSNGLATAVYQAALAETETATVVASLDADPSKTASFDFPITTAPADDPTLDDGPLAALAAGRGAKGPYSTNNAPSMLVGWRSIYSSYTEMVDLADKETHGFGSNITHYYISGKDSGKYGTEDELDDMSRRFDKEPFYFSPYGRDPAGNWWMSPARFQRNYTLRDNGFYDKHYENQAEYRTVNAIRVTNDVDPYNRQMTFIALVYKGTSSTETTNIDQRTLIGSGWIRVKGTRGEWSESLNDYCKNANDAVVVDPGKKGAELIEKKTNGYVEVVVAPIELRQIRMSNNMAEVAISGIVDGHVVPEQPSISTSIRFSRWLQAFTTAGDFKPTAIEDDNDRVVIRIAGDIIDPAKPPLKVSVSGLTGLHRKWDETFLRPKAQWGGYNQFWETEPFIFVTNFYDDEFSGIGKDNDINDQTILGDFGRDITLKFIPKHCDKPIEVTIGQICHPKHTVPVDATVLRGAEPATIAALSTAAKHINGAKLLYRQIGYDLAWDGRVFDVSMPTGFSNELDKGHPAVASIDSKVRVDWEYPPATGETFGEYLRRISGSTPRLQVYYLYKGRAELDGEVGGGWAVKGGNYGIISVEPEPIGASVTAHEIGHMLSLSHRGDIPYDKALEHFIMNMNIASPFRADHTGQWRFHIDDIFDIRGTID